MELTVKGFDALSTRELYGILQARVAVFVAEQRCPYQELDGKDFAATHVYYLDEGRIQAYVRVLPPEDGGAQAAIGRVFSVVRGGGLGKAIMLEGIRVAKDSMRAGSIYIEAQSYAKGFYEGLGFRQSSDEFLEDGIPHMQMLLDL